ncbi:alpha/beta hydrolase fold domain-containing protein [Shimia thalassica]|nr:alpha/beta hydrolase fold domain-containing protein [Shimia thalassica]MDP2582251.1 alpha/beta hydrolase fold domain-containing protein [Shimia thalassica]
MVSFAQRIVNVRVRYLEKPLIACVANQPLLRFVSGIYGRIAYKTHSDMQFSATRLGHKSAVVPALWCDQGRPHNDGVILYLHGGAYTAGGAASHKHLAARLAGVCSLRAVLPEYRLAPEHPFPAALEDAITSYHALLEKGYRGDQIVLAGDSAGGGLGYALLLHLLQNQLPLPRCVVALSPLVDMEHKGASFQNNKRAEMMLPHSWLKRAKRMYLNGLDPASSSVSPINGDFTGAPPSLILVGGEEILLDDARGMAAHLHTCGADATLIEQADVPHIWPTHFDHSPEADAAIDDIARFVRTQFNTSST